MKKILSIILALILTLSLFGGVISANAASTSFETDFSSFTSTECFKKIYDSDGKEIVGKFAFNITEDGLRYKREANEVFYNPSGGDRTTLGGHKAFPVSKTGKAGNTIYEVTAHTCYKIELTYNCTVLSQGATIVLTAAFSQGGNADVATNGKAANIKTTEKIGSNKNATIDKTGSATIVGYFTTGELAKDGSSVYNRLYVLLGSTDKSDVDITLTYLKVTPMSKIIVHDVNSGVDTYYYGASGEKFALQEEAVDEKYLISSKVILSKKASTLYKEETLETVVGNPVFLDGQDVTYYVANENVTLENQEVFCGFDDYVLRKDIKNQTNIGFKTLSQAIPENAQISNQTAYTGEKSLKIVTENADESVIYIGNGYELSNGATYRLTLRYRAENTENAGAVTFAFTSGNDAFTIQKGENLTQNTLSISKEQLNDGTIWKSAELYYTPNVTAENKEIYLAPVLSVESTDAVILYVDTLIISKVVSSGGTSILKNENDTQALRFYFNYDLKDENIVTDTKSKKIEKRGVLYASAENISDQSQLNLENDSVFKTEITDLSSCWDYDQLSGKTTFSAYLKDIKEKYFDKNLIIRGYVVLSDGTVYYSEVLNESVNSVKEKLNAKDMYYEIVDVGEEYKDIYVYIPTSDISGKYYIRYNFCYTNSEQDLVAANKANSGNNQETYRIKGAYLTEKTGDTFTVKMQGVLHEGELELAIKERGAVDFIGGYHGDEIMKYAKLYVDGEQITINGQTKGLTPCKEITFETDTTMYRCASGTAENLKGTAVCEHYLNYKINSKNGIIIDQKVTWLVDNFKNDVPMVCMFTIGRYTNGIKITDTVEYYKWDGSYIDTVDATGYGPGAEGTVRSSYHGPAYAVAYSKESGFKAKVGYKITSGLTDTFENKVWIRSYNDNKVYYMTNGGKTSQIGEVWEWTNYFNFDYVEK